MPEVSPAQVWPTLRVAHAGDESFLQAVYASTRPEMALLPWSPEEGRTFLDFQSSAQEQHYRNSHSTLQRQVIEQNGRLVGRLYRAETAAEHRVLDIAVLPDFRGQGWGTYLLQVEIERARVAGVPLRLHVEQSNPARRLYERLGFVLEADQGIYLALKWVTPRERG